MFMMFVLGLNFGYSPCCFLFYYYFFRYYPVNHVRNFMNFSWFDEITFISLGFASMWATREFIKLISTGLRSEE